MPHPAPDPARAVTMGAEAAQEKRDREAFEAAYTLDSGKAETAYERSYRIFNAGAAHGRADVLLGGHYRKQDADLRDARNEAQSAREQARGENALRVEAVAELERVKAERLVDGHDAAWWAAHAQSLSGQLGNARSKLAHPDYHTPSGTSKARARKHIAVRRLSVTTDRLIATEHDLRVARDEISALKSKIGQMEESDPRPGPNGEDAGSSPALATSHGRMEQSDAHPASNRTDAGSSPAAATTPPSPPAALKERVVTAADVRAELVAKVGQDCCQGADSMCYGPGGCLVRIALSRMSPALDAATPKPTDAVREAAERLRRAIISGCAPDMIDKSVVSDLRAVLDALGEKGAT